MPCVDEDALLALLLDETERQVAQGRDVGLQPTTIFVPSAQAIEKLDKLDPIEKFLVLTTE